MNALRARLARTPPGYRYSIGRVLAIYSGLMVALLLAALDQTIVATALPKVVSELGGITQYSWRRASHAWAWSGRRCSGRSASCRCSFRA
jgi:hypothetical protein